jgi:hypothetical protein
MTLDLKLAAIYFALAGLVLLLLLLLAGMRYIINHAFASSGHAFYIIATRQEPTCETCPFNKRCPYSDGAVCKFAKIRR